MGAHTIEPENGFALLFETVAEYFPQLSRSSKQFETFL